jgi:hypothetical protein
MTGLLSVWDVMIGAYRTVISHGLMDSWIVHILGILFMVRVLPDTCIY